MKITWWIWMLTVAVITGHWSCSAGRPAAVGTYTALYDFESYGLHPEFRVYHHHADSSTLFFRVRSSELLYMRKGQEDIPGASIRLDLILYGEGNNITDSLHLTDTDRRSGDPAGYLYGQQTFATSSGRQTLSVKFQDVNRGNMQDYVISVDRTSPFSPQHYLVRSATTGLPLFSPFAAEGDTVWIESALLIQSETRIAERKLDDISKLPPPPFSQNAPEQPDLTTASASYRIVQSRRAQLIMGKGSVFLSADPDGKQGVLLSATSPFFPEIRGMDQLTGPLRYITSKAEFDGFAKSSFAKPLIDEFWIECAGSRDRARELIRTYYSRVEESNRFFSTHTEGWRTDRGMIHIIFGNPSKIRRTSGEETWIYGEEGNPASLTFVFRKISSPLSDNLFVMQRDLQYRQVWEQMVTAWRQGRVFSD